MKWQDILPKFMTMWAFFPRNVYIWLKFISSGIATTTFRQYNHTGMLYFGYKLKIIEKYKYVIFRKVKQSKSVITTWKLPSSKVYHGLNNALGICVHEKHYQVLPTQMVPICENLGLGPWTRSVQHPHPYTSGTNLVFCLISDSGVETGIFRND